MMILNSHIGPVKTQTTNTQKMNNSETSTQKSPSLHVCFMDKSESKIIKAGESKSHICSMDDSESKGGIVNACSSEESESKSVNISVNTSKVTDEMNEKIDEEHLVIDNSVINVPISSKLFECSKNFLNNLDAIYERAYMATSQEN